MADLYGLLSTRYQTLVASLKEIITQHYDILYRKQLILDLDDALVRLHHWFCDITDVRSGHELDLNNSRLKGLLESLFEQAQVNTSKLAGELETAEQHSDRDVVATNA